MFQKVLIANRGEIAVRIIRACRDLGVSPVAVYSEADRTALHVRMADEAYPLGPSPSTESYLVIAKILEAARRCGAEAIHPGYGFLSENADFAQACADAGIALIGPSAQSMRLMGSKTAARSVLSEAGVSVVPGSCRPIASFEAAREEARRIGYPVMLKAASGGGGKGMRLVEREDRLAQAIETASSEAERAFSDPAVYLEKFIARPRHVEIQVLADHHGNAVYLGERECSIQRRHQKVIEESPSPALDEDLRRRMGETALRVVRTSGYVNAGTVEFLLDEQRSFYFLEMNTRLQVEHPVTEMVTGLDLVRAQLHIAAGEKLPFRQEDVRLQGWAMECRIYAEDPEHNFFPSPGKIIRLAEPSGPGVRVDSGVYEGWEVPIFYDPLIAKLVTWGADRNEAVSRLKRALREYHVGGIRTTLGFYLQILDDREFLAGRLYTGFIDEFLKRRADRHPGDSGLENAAAVAAAVAYQLQGRMPAQPASSNGLNPWKLSFRPGGTGGWRRKT